MSEKGITDKESGKARINLVVFEMEVLVRVRILDMYKQVGTEINMNVCMHRLVYILKRTRSSDTLLTTF